MKIGSTDISSIKVGNTTISKVYKGDIIYWGAIPESSDALFWLDGTIIDVGGTKYFKDQSGNLRNFLITNYDFSTNWEIGFPYKSAATISAPAGDAVLIAADVNNFLYDSGGTPNQIPVVSLFQDVDYEHKLFCRHITQVVDGNGVETTEPSVVDIVLYNTVKTGTGITKCVTYYNVPTEITTNVKWVSKTGNDSTGDGSKSKPWLTFVKANASAIAGDTVYVKTGIYEENSPYLSGSFYGNKSLTYIGIGGTVMQSTGTSYVCYLASGDYIFKNIVVDGENNKNTCVNVYSVGNKNVAWERCLFTRANTTIYNGQSVETVAFKYCLFLGKSASVTQTYATWATSIDTCYLIHCIVQISRDSEVINNKFYSNNKAYCYRVNNTSIDFIGNKSTYDGECLISNGSYTLAKTANIKYNIFTQGDSAIARCSAVYLTGTVTTNIMHNSFTSTVGNYSATTQYFVGLEDTPTPEISYNKFTSQSEKTFTHVGILVGGTVTLGACKINNNYSHSCSLVGTQITIGYEGTTTNKTDGSEFKNNRIIGYKLNNPSVIGATTHGVLLNCGINMDISYNFISHTLLGIVIKAGDQMAYTSNGIKYNLIKDCSTGIYIRGVSGINVFGNTIKHTSTTYGSTFANGIFADENSAKTGDQFSENIIIKNSIFDIDLSVGDMIHFDAHAGANGSIVDNCVTSGEGNILTIDGAATYSSLEGAQAGGWLINSSSINPSLDDNLIPATAISIGEDLGTNYNEGIDVTTTWGNTSTVPVIVTEQQSGMWKVGAYMN